MPKNYGYSKTFTFEGKRYRVRADSETGLAVKVAMKKKELEEGSKVITRSMEFRSWAERWLEVYKEGTVGDKWLKNIESILRVRILPHIGAMSIKEIRAIHVKQLLNSCEGMSRSYVTKVYNILNEIFAEAKRNGLCAENFVGGHVNDLVIFHALVDIVLCIGCRHESIYRRVRVRNHIHIPKAAFLMDECGDLVLISLDGEYMETFTENQYRKIPPLIAGDGKVVHTLCVVSVGELSVLKPLQVQYACGLTLQSGLLPYDLSVKVCQHEGVIFVLKDGVSFPHLLACCFCKSLSDIFFKVPTKTHCFGIFLFREKTLLVCPYCVRCGELIQSHDTGGI